MMHRFKIQYNRVISYNFLFPPHTHTNGAGRIYIYIYIYIYMCVCVCVFTVIVLGGIHAYIISGTCSGWRRWVSTVPGEHPTQADQRFTWSKTWCDRQQLWKAVMTGDTVTRFSIPIRGRGKSPEEGQRWNLAETLWKKKQHKNYQDEDKKSAINKN